MQLGTHKQYSKTNRSCTTISVWGQVRKFMKFRPFLNQPHPLKIQSYVQIFHKNLLFLHCTTSSNANSWYVLERAPTNKYILGEMYFWEQQMGKNDHLGSKNTTPHCSSSKVASLTKAKVPATELSRRKLFKSWRSSLSVRSCFVITQFEQSPAAICDLHDHDSNGNRWV